MVISQDAHILIDLNRLAIEQFNAFAFAPPAHLQPTLDFFQVKNMGGLTRLKHHVVGDIDQRVDTALPTT